MVSDLDCALLCYKTYFLPSYFDKVFFNGAVWVGYKLINGIPTFTCRGTDDPTDVFHDLESIVTIQHPVLGTVPTGFILGVDSICATIVAALPQLNQCPLIKFTGHSLGAAHAYYLGRLFKGLGGTVETVVFGLPHACGTKSLDYSVRAYKNGDDPVTDVPVIVPQIAQIPLIVETIWPDAWGPVKDHRIHYYIIGMALLACS